MLNNTLAEVAAGRMAFAFIDVRLLTQYIRRRADAAGGANSRSTHRRCEQP